MLLLTRLKALKARQEEMRGWDGQPGITLSPTICSADITAPLPPSHSPHPAQDLALERGYRWLILRPCRSDGRGKNLSQPAIRVDFSMEVHKVGYMEVRIQCRDQIRVLALRLTTGKKKTVFDKWAPPRAQTNKYLEHISKKCISNGTLDNTAANSSKQHKYFKPQNQSSTVYIDFSLPRFLCWRPEIARVKNSWDSWE